MITCCDWARCSAPAVAVEDGWAHCVPHLAEHRAEARDRRVAEMHALGASDTQIAANIGCDCTTIRSVRLRLGLSRIGKSGPKGRHNSDAMRAEVRGWR